jgi:hypothetical protein
MWIHIVRYFWPSLYLVRWPSQERNRDGPHRMHVLCAFRETFAASCFVFPGTAWAGSVVAAFGDTRTSQASSGRRVWREGSGRKGPLVPGESFLSSAVALAIANLVVWQQVIACFSPCMRPPWYLPTWVPTLVMLGRATQRPSSQASAAAAPAAEVSLMVWKSRLNSIGRQDGRVVKAPVLRTGLSKSREFEPRSCHDHCFLFLPFVPSGRGWALFAGSGCKEGKGSKCSAAETGHR